jgi:hypothetical protein
MRPNDEGQPDLRKRAAHAGYLHVETIPIDEFIGKHFALFASAPDLKTLSKK